MAARLVVLDAAGTLLEVEGSVGEIYAEIAAAAGAELEPSAVETGFRRGMAAAPPLAFGARPPSEREAAERDWWRAVARRALEAAGPLPAGFDFTGFFDRAWERFAEPDAWRVYEDVRPGLRALRRAGHPLAVFSNWDARLERLLARLGLAGYFARVVCSGGLTAAKPDPDAFRAAREALGSLAAGASPVMVGDRRDHDVEPARAAGWSAVWLDRANAGDGASGGRVESLIELAAHPAVL